MHYDDRSGGTALYAFSGVDCDWMKEQGGDMRNKENSNVTFGDTWSSPVFNQQIQLIFISPGFICVIL